MNLKKQNQRLFGKMTKYTNESVKKQLKNLDKVRKLKEHQAKLMNQLEITLKRIQLALKPTLDFKLELVQMKKIIKKEFEKTDSDKADKEWLIGLLARTRIKKKYNFIPMPQHYFDVQWKDFIFYATKTFFIIYKRYFL